MTEWYKTRGGSNWWYERCRDCIYLYEGDDGDWMCDHMGTNCEDVPDEDCPAEADFKE